MMNWLTHWVSSSSGSPAKAAIEPPSSSSPAVNPLNPQGLKPCCACPETKSARDECFMNTDPSEADEKCKALVQAHVACMRGYGFKV